MSGGSITAGSTGREELDECQEGVYQLVLKAERKSGVSTTAGSTGREELDECQEGVHQLVVQAERN
jgi:hypothetical protein